MLIRFVRGCTTRGYKFLTRLINRNLLIVFKEIISPVVNNPELEYQTLCSLEKLLLIESDYNFKFSS